MIVWDVNKVLENSYYVSGIVIAVIAGFGLQQLRLTKRNTEQAANLAKIAAKREAYKLAAERCDFYLRELVPLINAGYKIIRDNGHMDILCLFELEVNADEVISNASDANALNALKTIFSQPDALKPFVEIANALEGFSLLFVSGVASEEVAFSSIGNTFCYTVRDLAPVILRLGRNKHFQNLFHLFQIWQQRLDAQELLRQHKSIVDQLAKTQRIGIDPIGT